MSVAGYNDLTPRLGVAYDLFGNGKTALKVNLGKYLQAATNDENYWANNPANRIVTRVTARGWVDGNVELHRRLRFEQPAGAGQRCDRWRHLRTRWAATT